MQQELDAEALRVTVLIRAVNAPSEDVGFLSLPETLTLPWLQDNTYVAAGSAWGVTYRDVVVLGRDNQRITVFNLTEHDLNDPGEYAALKEKLTAAAR